MLTFNQSGLLFPGIHVIDWDDFYKGFSFSAKREFLFGGLKSALLHFKAAGCSRVYIDGSFVTKKTEPGDYDACWDMSGVDFDKVDPVFLDGLRFGTLAQKLKYLGEFYPASFIEGNTNVPFLEFFQTDKVTGNRKGIIEIRLEGVN